MAEIKDLLDEQIVKDLEDISKQKLGEESRKESINQLMDLHRMRMDETKIEQERIAHEKDRDIQTKLDIAGLVVPNTILLGSFIAGFVIETNGVITSKTFERILRFIKPEKLLKFFKL